MFKKNPSIPELETSNHKSIIGPSVKVEGEFNGKGNLIIDGSLSGKISIDKNLEITGQAQVAANIEAENAVIAGTVKGNIKILNELVLKPTAKVRGDIICKKIAIELGAKYNGKCTTTDEIKNSEIKPNGQYKE